MAATTSARKGRTTETTVVDLAPGELLATEAETGLDADA
jgi:hypothetical protein